MERSDQMFKVRAAELRKILVELGPAYIKIAQAVSSRPGLDALGLATLDSLTSAATTRIPFTGSSVSFMSKEDMINLRTFHRMFLLAGLESNKKSFEEVNGVGNPNNNQSAYLEESSLLSYQPALVSEILAMLSIIPELPPELQQQLLRLPADLARRLISRASARTIQRIFL
ncbi:hypothetical protein E1A91_A06G119700v1 [Gossypium mustelinum]|uniref:Uncharacterized protein n=1 Tax=Gossypium mustelinum TaxID=34275 RepID=A0A5D2YYZ1_GOSMU|nr:hypothetical protein E1A91_A06G119700v1 [Gossypium mustelinum]TYJ30243.1 hypothetical protein E1A91_A06G119700v1 [Gossypium mustelinum]